MPFAASLSRQPRIESALDQLAEPCLKAVPKPELSLLFFSPHHLNEIDQVASRLMKELAHGTVIGCVGETIVGGSQEVEQGPAASLWVGSWDGKITIESFHMTPARTPDGWSLMGWPDALMDADPAQSAVITLGDPYTFPADQLFLPRLNEDHPGLPAAGGMASGVSGPGMTKLIRDGQVVDQGAVGVLLRGPLKMRSVVSQGCRPIGRPLVVTQCQGGLITGLGGKAPLDQLRELWPQLPPRDQELFRRGPHLGLVTNEYQESFARGDFLIRNVTGIDNQNGAIAVTDHVRVGQTVQFHVRDAEAADEDMVALLRQDVAGNPGRAAGALLFSCNGRGTRMFPGPNHDASTIQREMGEMPLAGFFAAGEIGPVGGKNFLHGFTASVVLFED